MNGKEVISVSNLMMQKNLTQSRKRIIHELLLELSLLKNCYFPLLVKKIPPYQFLESAFVVHSSFYFTELSKKYLSSLQIEIVNVELAIVYQAIWRLPQAREVAFR